MPRVKRGTKRVAKRRKVLKIAKGYYGTRSKAYRIAMQAVDKALAYQTRDRRARKRQFRRLWIARINAAARINGLSYSRLMDGLKKKGVALDRKILAHLALHDAAAFARVADTAKAAFAS